MTNAGTHERAAAFLEQLMTWMEERLGVSFSVPEGGPAPGREVSFHFHDEDGACLPASEGYASLGMAIMAALEEAFTELDADADLGLSLMAGLAAGGVLLQPNVRHAHAPESWSYTMTCGCADGGFEEAGVALASALLRHLPAPVPTPAGLSFRPEDQPGAEASPLPFLRPNMA